MSALLDLRSRAAEHGARSCDRESGRFLQRRYSSADDRGLLRPLPPQAEFLHRENRDGRFDSICSECFSTVATRGDEADLSHCEDDHVCEDWKRERAWSCRRGITVRKTNRIASRALDPPALRLWGKLGNPSAQLERSVRSRGQREPLRERLT